MPTLKKQNRKTLVGFILINVVLFSLFSNNFIVDTTGIIEMLKNPFDPKIISILLLFGLSIILEGVLSSNLKAIIIFNRIKQPLPGCRVFTTISQNDKRIDYKKLLSIYNNKIPTIPNDQNSEWYRLYKLYAKVEVVEESHKAFLLTRDLLAFSIILFFISTFLHIIIGTNTLNLIYSIAIYLILIIILKISAYNYGNRFTANVLVEYINSFKFNIQESKDE